MKDSGACSGCYKCDSLINSKQCAFCENSANLFYCSGCKKCYDCFYIKNEEYN